MTSTIKVDTISENTSANGVSIDGLTIKDGNINESVKIVGTTPTLTIGDAGAEDAKIVFDGNAQDFHIGLDDSSDDLVIGVGSALGTTTAISITDGRAVTVGEAGIASSVAGIPFYNGDTTSIYTHDVSGTDNTATHNTAYGITALDAITTGDANTAIGWSAGSALNTGTQNTIVGKGALASASSAGSNTAIGWNAAYAVTTGTTAITAIGDGAYNSAGDTETHNMAIGVNAMAAASLAGAEFNIAIGNYTLDALTSADDNTVVGYDAGTAITTGGQNTLIGEKAGLSLTTGYMNTFIGRRAGVTGNIGNQNTAVGTHAMYESAGASYYNTSLGYAAGYNISTGDNNLFLGTNAGRSTSPAGAVTTANNQVCLGDDNITAIFCADTSISSSDKRDKTDIKNFTAGLSFIEKMQPVTYKWDKRSWYSDDLSATPDGSKKETKTNVGFLAQDVETLEKEIGFANDKNDMLFANLTNDGQRYGMKYERLVTVLVNAVKELSAKVKALEDA